MGKYKRKTSIVEVQQNAEREQFHEKRPQLNYSEHANIKRFIIAGPVQFENDNVFSHTPK